jgi:hypothetical protein
MHPNRSPERTGFDEDQTKYARKECGCADHVQRCDSGEAGEMKKAE